MRALCQLNAFTPLFGCRSLLERMVSLLLRIVNLAPAGMRRSLLLDLAEGAMELMLGEDVGRRAGACVQAAAGCVTTGDTPLVLLVCYTTSGMQRQPRALCIAPVSPRCYDVGAADAEQQLVVQALDQHGGSASPRGGGGTVLGSAITAFEALQARCGAMGEEPEAACLLEVQLDRYDRCLVSKGGVDLGVTALLLDLRLIARRKSRVVEWVNLKLHACCSQAAAEAAAALLSSLIVYRPQLVAPVLPNAVLQVSGKHLPTGRGAYACARPMTSRLQPPF